MKEDFFKVLHRSKISKARVGEINTTYGSVKTPAFVPVATKGTLKALAPSQIKGIGIQIAFVNTYHLVDHPGADIISKAGGIHQYSRLNIPLMSDSGGFQVFSFDQRSSKLQLKEKNCILDKEKIIVKISDQGVLFRSVYDGKLIEFTPEKSIDFQLKIGADIMIAFDQCIAFPSNYQNSKRAMERTHGWLIRCIERFESYKRSTTQLCSHENLTASNAVPSKANKLLLSHDKSHKLQATSYKRYLYGVIQGGTYKGLRKSSAEFVCSQDIDGIAIGGVAVGESKIDMRKQVNWVADYLPSDKPVHLLGVGQFDDILDLVKCGIDTFDCVEPTRLARMGILFQVTSEKFKVKNYLLRHTESASYAGQEKFQVKSKKLKVKSCEQMEIDILKARYKADFSPVDENCECYTCLNFTKSYLHHLFKQKEILGYTLATIHNLFSMERFFATIREAIINNKL